MDKEYNLYHHELLDRLHCLSEIFDATITNHNSDDILSQEEKGEIALQIGMAYQLVGQRMHEREVD